MSQKGCLFICYRSWVGVIVFLRSETYQTREQKNIAKSFFDNQLTTGNSISDMRPFTMGQQLSKNFVIGQVASTRRRFRTSVRSALELQILRCRTYFDLVHRLEENAVSDLTISSIASKYDWRVTRVVGVCRTFKN